MVGSDSDFLRLLLLKWSPFQGGAFLRCRGVRMVRVFRMCVAYHGAVHWFLNERASNHSPNFSVHPYCWWFRNPKQPTGTIAQTLWIMGRLNYLSLNWGELGIYWTIHCQPEMTKRWCGTMDRSILCFLVGALWRAGCDLWSVPSSAAWSGCCMKMGFPRPMGL